MKNPRIVIRKKQRLLKIYDGKRLIRKYKFALGFAPVGDKKAEGDGKTPEGEFYVCAKNPASKFYLSLALSYPNEKAAKRGLKEKIITQTEHDAIIKAVAEKRMPLQNTRLGGEIYIHGGGIEEDWTKGCVALRNEEMKEIFDAIPIGTTVKITS